jgi:hypothetical protein
MALPLPPLPPTPIPNTISLPPPTFPANPPLPTNHHSSVPPPPPPYFGSLPAQSTIGWPFPHYTLPAQTCNTFTPQILPQANPIFNLPQTQPIPLHPHPKRVTAKSIRKGTQRTVGSQVCSFRVGAKHFSFDFDGGRTAPYHITEKRGRFVGSLWLGLKSLHWLTETWGSLRQTEDLKGFFRFLRT